MIRLFRKNGPVFDALSPLMNKVSKYLQSQMKKVACWLNQRINRFSAKQIAIMLFFFTFLSAGSSLMIILNALRHQGATLRIDQIELPASRSDSLETVEKIYKALQKKQYGK